MEFLFELDSPSPESDARAKDPKRSTMDFLFELDAPNRTPSREIDLAAHPQIAAALAAHGSPTTSVEAPPAAPAVEPEPETEPAAETRAEADPLAEAEPVAETLLLPDLGAALPDSDQLERRVSLAPPDKPKTAEQQQQQRLRRALLRVVVCRDAFRLLGFLGIADEDRKGVARMLMELDSAFGRREGQPSLIKEPELALKGASQEQLDTIDRLIGPIEDKLLAHDEAVPPETFNAQLDNRKHSRKIIARYGRLLVSRRIAAGQRRDRFEAIATHLLTLTTDSGEHQALAPDRAKPVLEHLIGGLPRKINEEELNESLTSLREMIGRLANLTTLEQFFENFFLDMHGYKVMMREQLLSPEFLYLSVYLNAKVHNRVEAWIADLERLHNTNQLTSEGRPREQIARRLLELEDAVDNMFGVKRRPPPQAARAEPAKPAPAAKRAKTKERESSRFKLDIVVDRQLFVLAGAFAVILGVGIYLAVATGAVGATVVEALSEEQLTQFSPILVRGWLKGSGADGWLDASVQAPAWKQLEPRKRADEAEHIARELAARGMKRAHVMSLQGARVIEIENGVVAYVEGGKL